MNKVYLLIGGNLGNRLDNLNGAKLLIEENIGAIDSQSSIYETAPWGFDADQDFLNQVIIVNSKLSAQDILNSCQEVENDLGRIRESGNYISRTMDIDILFYNDEIINEPDLIVPHEHIHKRRFTLEPLAELSPEFIHPFFNKTLLELLKTCNDNSQVKKL